MSIHFPQLTFLVLAVQAISTGIAGIHRRFSRPAAAPASHLLFMFANLFLQILDFLRWKFQLPHFHLLKTVIADRLRRRRKPPVPRLAMIRTDATLHNLLRSKDPASRAAHH